MIPALATICRGGDTSADAAGASNSARGLSVTESGKKPKALLLPTAVATETRLSTAHSSVVVTTSENGTTASDANENGETTKLNPAKKEAGL